MKKNPKPQYTINDFDGDLNFDLNETGSDVEKIQKILLYFGDKYGYAINPQEITDHRFGPTSQAAAETLRAEAAKNPREFTQDKTESELLELFLQVVFHIDADELSEKFARGHHKGIAHYREANKIQFEALTAGALPNIPTPSKAANLALQFVGQREQSGNRGPMVAMFCGGQQGLPWCGGFVDYMMSETYGNKPKIYAQENPLSAGSYETEAKKYDAFHGKHGDYTPKAGDVVVFDRAGGKHVGIVTGVSEDGVVSYVAGNSSNAVRESTFPLDHPPQSLRGYSATQEIAAAKNIPIEQSLTNNSYKAPVAHRDTVYNRG